MEICQSHLPIKPWAHAVTRRLPGTQPIGPDDWLLIDDAFDLQMQYADQLIATRRADVVASSEIAAEAEAEVLDTVLAWTRTQPGYGHSPTQVIRPDGVAIDIAADTPLVTARRLVQEDLLIHLSGEHEHWLASGVLTFPASWALHQKVGRGLTGVHDPVTAYTDKIAVRVERLFKGLQIHRPIMRANVLLYDDPDLFQPRLEGDDRDRANANRYVRVERQCLIRLPKTRAVVFSIHSFVMPTSLLSARDFAAIRRHVHGASGDTQIP